MRKRKDTRSVAAKTLPNSASELEEEEDEAANVQLQEENGFFACYLLASLNPRYKGHSYIGFTVNPRRRIRQHNGEIGSGAYRTKKRRPWEMVLCIYGFPTNVSALQFEWAWQHPVESLAVRKAAVGFKSLSGIANKIKLAYTMLTLPSWQSMNITVNFFSTKYMKHCAGCPSLPKHMKIEIGAMDELPCYTERVDSLSENEDDDCIDDVEFDNNNTSTSGDFITPDSPNNANHRHKISEAFELNKESEAREPLVHSFASQEQCQPFGSITPPRLKSPSATLSKRVEIIEDSDIMKVMNETSADLSQPESKRSGAISAADRNRDVNSTFIVSHEPDIIDLTTPSPSCRSIVDRKKRRVTSSSVGTDFIDLTKSPNFVQL